MDNPSANGTTLPLFTRTAKNWFAAIFVGLVLGVGGTIYYGRQLVAGIIDYSQTTQLMEQGVVVGGFITDKHSKKSVESTFYYVSYRFSAEGVQGEIDSEQKVSEEFYGNIDPKAPVRIRYLKGSPDVSRLDTELQNPSFPALLFSTCVLLVFTLVFLARIPFALHFVVRRLGPFPVGDSI